MRRVEMLKREDRAFLLILGAESASGGRHLPGFYLFVVKYFSGLSAKGRLKCSA
jgi:hypothetical protein